MKSERFICATEDGRETSTVLKRSMPEDLRRIHGLMAGRESEATELR